MRFSFPWLKNPAVPGFFFITHAKAGSTWIDDILRDLFGKQVAPRFGSDLSKFHFQPGKIYSAAFISREQFESFPEIRSIPRFVVIRDLRDTLVSRYFSMRFSHRLDAGGAIAKQREQLEAASLEEGLLDMLNEGVSRSAQIQRSWLEINEPIWRYEDLITKDIELLSKLFLEHLKLPTSKQRLEKAIIAHRFENVFHRKLGEVDTQSHGRTGTPGDWKNHFSKTLAQRFDEKYGDLLIAAGYEPDHRWVEQVK